MPSPQPEPEESAPSPKMESPSSSPPATSITTSETSALEHPSICKSTGEPINDSDTSKQDPVTLTPSQIDYRAPIPPALNTLSRCLSDIHISLNLAIKLTTYMHTSRRTSSISITIPTLFTFPSILSLHNHNNKKGEKSKSKKSKNKDATLRQDLIDALKAFLIDDELSIDGKGEAAKEFGKMFSGFVEWNENRSREFVLEIARCEGVREYIESTCTQHLTTTSQHLLDTIISPLTHSLSTSSKTIPNYSQLISATHEIHQQTVNAIKESTVRLKELVELANRRLVAVPEDGELWDEDYNVFAVTKKKAREDFAAESLGL